jgi:hypothetical protein
MSLFKYKPPKKIILDERSISTLDSKHKELQTEFQYIQDTIIPELENERNSLKERLLVLKSGSGGGGGGVGGGMPEPSKHKTTIDECLELRDRIKEITATIKKHQLDYKNYYLNNSEYIFEYFETKKTITNGGSMKTKSLNAFFNLPEAKKTEELFKNQHNNVEKYMASIDQNYMDVSKYVYSTDICQFCRQGEMIPKSYFSLIMKNRPIKSRLKRRVFTRINASITSAKSSRNFRQKRRLQFPNTCLKALNNKSRKSGLKSLNSPIRKRRRL